MPSVQTQDHAPDRPEQMVYARFDPIRQAAGKLVLVLHLSVSPFKTLRINF